MTNPIDLAVMTRAQSVLSTRAHARSHPTPILASLRNTGTRHLYGDTADVDELADLLTVEESGLRDEIDGNTANQPLVAKVVERYLDASDPRDWAREFRVHRPGLSRANLLVLLYTTLLGRIGNDMARCFASDRKWEASLQLHMSLANDADAARATGRLLYKTAPSAIIKVPFTPDVPHCFLVARDLERDGIPVNFTSTFSARQAVAAALLANVSRTNIFMGRLNQGLQSERLGEHVDLVAQRALLELRRRNGIKTRLIVASIRDWQTFVRVAGCDVFTAPCTVFEEFLHQEEVSPSQIVNQLETSYEDDLGINAEVLDTVGGKAIPRLYHIETEFVQFLHDLRSSPEFAKLDDGEELYKRFDQAGFGDLFHVPSPAERQELQESKLPRLDGRLIGRIPLDTHYSLLANADFTRHQREIDAAFTRRLE